LAGTICGWGEHRRSVERVEARLGIDVQAVQARAAAGLQVTVVVYGALGDDPATKSVGMPVDGRPGDLITFPSDMLHEVQPVTGGLRHTALSWFVSGSGPA
jgi:hypothetical protein